MRNINSRKRWDMYTCITLTTFSIAILFPLFWKIRTSVAPDIVAYQFKIFFKPVFSHYGSLFTRNNFGRFIFNSMIISQKLTI